MQNTVKKISETFRDDLLISSHFKTLCISMLILAAKPERCLSLAYNVV